MNKTSFFSILSIASCTIANAQTANEKDQKPNVIIILADDLGYKDVGFNGCEDIPTPNIDRIARNGVKFSNAYVTYSVSGPSRAGIITGRYQDRFGFGRNPLFTPNDTLQGLPSTEETLATVLGRSNYKSVAFGKWHLGAHPTQHPLKKGFDEFFGFLDGGHNYFPEKWTLNDASEMRRTDDGYKTKLIRNYGKTEENEYLTDALSREAVAFVERNSNQPFFMYLAYNAPHGPLQATEKYLNRFLNIKNINRRTYAAMVSAMDDGVGLLLDKLTKLGIEDNTIVFFLSDNGGPEKDNASNNGELREGKSSLYEGGIRVPFAMQWPAKIKRGLVYEKPILSLDMFATAIHYAKATPKNKIDGVNLIPFLTGENNEIPHKSLFWRKFDQKAYAVRNGDMKLLNYKSDTLELYNLKKDIGEENCLPLSAENNYSALKDKYNRWLSEMKDPEMWGLGQDKAYLQKHPNRFKLVHPYKPDTFQLVAPDGYQLIWSDEFDGSGKPNEKFWSYENGFVRNNELQWYQQSNATVENGLLVIEGRREKVKNNAYEAKSKNWKLNREFAEYTSACIKTKDKFSFQYGIMEVRARIDTSLGMWPAIWTLGVEGKWPANGEVDQMEFYRVDKKATILANAAWSDEKMQAKWDSEKIPLSHFLFLQPDWVQRFHVWKMDWTPEYIRLYLDDELLNEIDLSKTIHPDGKNPFHQAQYILLNLAIGAQGGNPTNSRFPSKYEVDYVRVFQKK